MSTHESLDVTPATPSPAPRSFGSVLQFARPARGKKSQSDLRKAPSNASMKMQVAKASNAESELDSDEVLSRSVSPTPSALSVGNTSQFQLPNALPREDGLDLASEALQKLMEDAHSGSFAAGALGQKLLDQQEHMRQLMQQLEEVSEREGENRAALVGTSEQASSPAALLLLEQIHDDITRMKGEQEDLMRELLHASNTNMGAVGLSPTSKAEAEAIIHSYGGMPESTSYNSISATPTKPASSNARELRRQRNAAAPNLNKDEVLVNDIQQQLINELRRLQALVAERDKALAAMTDAVEEAARYKAIQEANIKKLETEKDAKDANLYEAERKEAIVREENEDVVRQLKKHENEVRLLRRQLGEKTDAAETLKVSNEDLEQKVADMLGNLATLRAKGAADQLAINGLKAQVGDLELKQRQAASKIPPSSSNLSSTASYDHSSVDSNHAGNETIAPDGPAGKRGKGHDQALTPSASLDESLASRLRTSDAVRGMETEVAKWKGAALKYRKKWAEERKHTGGDVRAREHDYDDSTDEDEDVWMDEAAKAGDVRKRSMSTKSRIVSDSSSRKSSKTMGDAFGIQRYSKRSSMTWEDEEADMLDRSFGGDDDASSNAASSTRGSIDGFDPNFADPTIRSGADAKGGAGSFKRRSTYTPANVHGAKGSPLARQLQLQGDSDDESNMSNDRPSSVIYQPGALGDELAGLQGDEGEREGGQAEDSLMEDHQAAMEAALAERESAHEAALAEREKTHQIMLSQSIETHESALRDREAAHQDAVKLKDDAHQSQLAAIHKEHADSLAQHTQMHTKAVALLHEKHGQALAGREEQLEAAVAEAEKRHEERLKEAGTRQAKQHDEAMAVARERHAQVLSTAREEAQADMVSVQMEHRRLLEEREAAHAEGLERLKATHSRAIMEKEQEHRDHIGDIETSNEEYHRMRDDAFGKMLTKQEDLIRAKDGEITTLQARLSALETELKELRQKVQASELDGSSHTQALQEVQDQLRVAKEERTVAESRLAVLTESSAAREAMLDNDDEFQDAEDASQSHGGEREDPRISSDMARRDTSSTHDTISVATPANEMDVAVQTKDAGESREERAAQTDDDMWTRHQHDQLTTATRPPSSMLELEDGTTNAGAGGIVILGGDQAFRMNNNFTPSEQRPRDSISTFGGNRNGTSNRTESPAPTMYTVGAFTGRGAASDWSRRPSIDSTVSAKAAGTNAEGEEILRVPDRSKPPTMQVPPPPSMPPPPSVPAKQNVAAAIPSVVTHHSGVSQGSVEELELEDTSTPKAPNKLRVPPDTSSRPSSRVSGPPPSAFPAGRNSVGKAGRVRTTSTGSRARRETDAASIVSRTSARRTHASVRAPSAQSFASDVTSEFSRMSGVSSRASDYADGGQQRTMIVGPGGQAVSTDPLVLSSITQTMIGDYLYKYTRRSMGRAGHSDRRHKRYFWVHPYTRTLYWTLQAPSEAVAAEAINKSAFIQDVLLVEDSNNSPPGLYHMSILIMTQAREVKITAPTREKHELWITALSYLVNRDGGSTPAVEKAPSEWRQSISRAGGAGGNARRRSQTSGPGSASVSKRPSMLSPARSFASMSRKNASVDDMDRDQTPRARGYSVSQASTAQRKDTAAKNYLEELEALKTFSGRPSSTRVTAANGGASVAGGRPPSRSLAHEMFGQESRDPRTMTAEEMLEEDNENSDFDGLDNVRACCNGKHDVGVLAHRSHTHTHTANRAKSSTTSVATGSLRGSRRASKAPEDKPLKLSSAAPQLGPLSLNTMHSSKTAAEGQAKTSTSTQASSDWFSANEYSGRMTPQSMTYQPGSQPSSPKAPSYTDRVAQIRKAKQPWLR